MSERGNIVRLLQSDLYERVPDADPETGMTWESPLKWRVRISGSRHEPDVVITRPDGKVYATLQRTSAADVDAVLP